MLHYGYYMTFVGIAVLTLNMKAQRVKDDPSLIVTL